MVYYHSIHITQEFNMSREGSTVFNLGGWNFFFEMLLPLNKHKNFRGIVPSVTIGGPPPLKYEMRSGRSRTYVFNSISSL